jgi:hypothetical protein
MRTRVDLQLTEEAKMFALRFACDDCVHFDDQFRCEHGYPPAPRREDLLREEIVFCKEFEIA